MSHKILIDTKQAIVVRIFDTSIFLYRVGPLLHIPIAQTSLKLKRKAELQLFERQGRWASKRDTVAIRGANFGSPRQLLAVAPFIASSLTLVEQGFSNAN